MPKIFTKQSNLPLPSKETLAGDFDPVAQNHVAAQPISSAKPALNQLDRGTKKFNAHNTFSTLKKLTVIGAISQSPLANARIQQKTSARVNVPTLDTLQQCSKAELAKVKQKLIEDQIFVENVPILCVDKKTYSFYKTPAPNWSPEAKTNCYGDAIGIADFVMPSNSAVFPITCNRLIKGALKDGATLSVDNKCPENTRQMRFSVSENKSDFHVISRGADDKTWMQKFASAPRMLVSPVPIPTYNNVKLAIYWYKTDAKDNESTISLDPTTSGNSQWCKPTLCSLPDKIDIKHKPAFVSPPAEFYAMRQRQTSIAIPEQTWTVI